MAIAKIKSETDRKQSKRHETGAQIQIVLNILPVPVCVSKHVPVSELSNKNQNQLRMFGKNWKAETYPNMQL